MHTPAITPPPLPVVNDAIGIGGGARLELAATIEQRRRAWALVYRSYRRKGFAEEDGDGLWYSVHDALPATATTLITDAGIDVATLTQVFDGSALGLPADALYADELAHLRRQGRRLCELVSLACESEEGRLTVLMHLFRMIMIGAAEQRVTDLIITVNPRHRAFYTRTLLFTQIGDERAYGKVAGAPAVLLRLDVTDVRERLRARDGETGKLFSFFYHARDLMRLERLWRRNRRPIPPAALRPFFDGRLPGEEPVAAQQTVCAGPNGPSARFKRIGS